MKKATTIIAVVLILIIAGLFIYDSLIFRPSAKITFGDLADVKKGNEVATSITIINEGKADKEFTLLISVTDPDGKALFSAEKQVLLKKQESYTYELKSPIAEESPIGTYFLTATANASKTIFSFDKPVIAELKNSFSVVEKIRKADIVSLSVSAPAMKTGKTFTLNAKVKNTGETTHEFHVFTRFTKPNAENVDFAVKKISLKQGETQTISETLDIPLTGEAGKYSAYACIGTSADQDGKVSGTKDESTKEFEVAAPVISGKMSLSIDGSKKNFDDSVKIKASFVNSGEIKAEFTGKIIVSGPNNSEKTVFDEKIEIEAGETAEKAAEFKIEPSMADGDYKISAEMTKPNSEKCGDGSASFSVTDKFPVVVMFVGVSPAIFSEAGQITVLVRDDKKIDTVKLHYTGPGQTSEVVEEMTKLDGDERQATFQAKTPAFQQKGTLKYLVEVTDSKGQTTKSMESISELKEKVDEPQKQEAPK